LNPKVKEFFLGIGVQAFFPDPVQTLERSHKEPLEKVQTQFSVHQSFPVVNWAMALVGQEFSRTVD